MPETESFDAVIIGSGFGGTVSALVLANLFQERRNNEHVCILERGQWWVSHEIPSRPREIIIREGKKKNMREYLEDEGLPFGFWAHPDNIEGMFELLSMSRQISRKGLYDFRILSKNVQAITASGVGGGSLVYSNVTVPPEKSAYEDWPTEKSGKSIAAYFQLAEEFIGVNKITTVTGITDQKIVRSLFFQDAAKRARENNTQRAKVKNSLIVLNENDDYDLKLAITDIKEGFIPTGVLDRLTPAQRNDPEIVKRKLDEVQTEIQKISDKYAIETNVCQRQARCNLGCLPGARHTLNKKLFKAINKGLPLTVNPLCEAYLIEFRDGEEFQYKISYKQTEKGNVKEKVVLAKILIVSAGNLGTTELLLKSREQGLRISGKLGEQFITNADLFSYMELEKKRVDNTRGPINTSHVVFGTSNKKFAFSIEDTAVPPMVAGLTATILEYLSAEKLGFSRKLSLFRKYRILYLAKLSTWLRFFIRIWLNDRLREPSRRIFKWIFLGNGKKMTQRYSFWNFWITNRERPFASPAERLEKFFIFSCMGIDNEYGTLKLVPKWTEMETQNDYGEKLGTDWSPDNNKQIFQDMTKGVQILAGEIEGGGDKRVMSMGWDEKDPSKSSLILLHPLGGCPMGHDSDSGAVNSYGQVFRRDSKDKTTPYPDFLIVDGSIIPSAPGVNPSLTITALALRCMEHFVEEITKEKFPGWEKLLDL